MACPPVHSAGPALGRSDYLQIDGGGLGSRHSMLGRIMVPHTLAGLMIPAAIWP